MGCVCYNSLLALTPDYYLLTINTLSAQVTFSCSDRIEVGFSLSTMETK